jgi:serine/threonine protein kinase
MHREVEHAKSEREILARIGHISHPFLIKLHHSFQDVSQLFLVFDYHVGGDMATQLAKWYKFPPMRCRLYTAEILLGIQELHRLGILYRYAYLE